MICTRCDEHGYRVAMAQQPTTLDGEIWLLCPRCYASTQEKPSTIRVAQFGGKGGGGSMPYSPGKSPMTQGGGGGGNSGQNEPYIDQSLDAMMEKTRKNFPIDEKRNMETRLEPFHNYVEDDEIPYNLSIEERMKLKIKKQIRRREKYITDCRNSIYENSPKFINEHYFPKQETMQTMEQSLESRHLEPKNKVNPYEDQVPPQDKPTRVHPVMSSTRLSADNHWHNMTNRLQGDDEDQDTQFDPFSADKMQRSHLNMGNEAPPLKKGKELDEYLDEAAGEDLGGGLKPIDDEGPGMSMRETTLTDYPGADQVGDHSAPNTPALPSPLPHVSSVVEKSPDAIFDPAVPIQGKLNQLTKQKTDRLPHDPYNNPYQGTPMNTQQNITSPDMDNQHAPRL